MMKSLLWSAEGRTAWRGCAGEAAARRLWRDAAPGYGADAAGFAAAWRASRDLPDLAAHLLAHEPVRAVPILLALFPDGVDPADDEAGPAWAYRLWSLEAERALSSAARRLFPLLRLAGPAIGLALELHPGDDAHALSDTLASLAGQIYGRWRLQLQGPLPDGVVLPADPRIARGGTIWGRAAWPRRRPFWSGSLRVGDTLSPAALALFAYAALRRPWAAAIFCDEDRRRPDGSCAEPWLKTAWDPDAAETADVVGSLVLNRGRSRPGVGSGRVVHLPAVLHHAVPRPGAPSGRSFDQPDDGNVSRVVWTPAPAGPSPAQPVPTLSVVIATRDRADLLTRCVSSLRARTDYPAAAIEIVLVDNGSREPAALALLDRLEREGYRLLRRPGPFNWSALCNDGVRASTGELVVLMNNDIACIDAGWARALADACLRPGVGVAGALLLHEDGAVQHAGVVVGPGARAVHLSPRRLLPHARLQGLAAVTGACMALRRSTFDRLDGLDESLPVTWNDIDLCLRARRTGLRVLLARNAVLMHVGSATRSADTAPENQAQLSDTRARVAARHRRALRVDPFLNPLLAVADGGRSLDPAAPARLWRVLRGGGR